MATKNAQVFQQSHDISVDYSHSFEVGMEMLQNTQSKEREINRQSWNKNSMF